MENYEGIDPNKTIGYWLFYTQRCVSYAFAEIMRMRCEELGKPYVVTPPQWGILALLYEEDGQTVSAISQQRGVDAPTVTGIVKRLELAELVSRRHDRIDRRVVKVYLTDEGRSITTSLYPSIQAFGNDTMRDFSEGERHQFLTMLQRIVANVSDESLGIGDRFNLLPEYVVQQRFTHSDRDQKSKTIQHRPGENDN